MPQEVDKETFLKIIYDLENALKSKKDEAGQRLYSDDYIKSLLKNLEDLFDNKSLTLVKTQE